MTIIDPVAAPGATTSEPRVRVARTLTELEQLRSAWAQATPANAEADIDFLAEIVRSFPEVVRPHVVVIERDGLPPLMAVARLEERRLETKVGYRVVLRPRMRILTVVYSGLIGAEDPADRELLLDELRAALTRREADVLAFTKLRTGTELFDRVASMAPWACRDHLPAVFPRTDVAVPDTLAEFLQARSRNTRENIKRYGKRLEKAHGDALRVHAYREESDLDEVFARFEPVAATTYQRALGVGFADDPQQRALTALALRQGWFRGWALSIGDKPVAFWYGIAYAGTFYIGSPGYDPAYGDLRVGQYLQMRMMEDLCADDGVHRLDYGFGDAQYKRSFGDTRWEEADVLVFAARPRALAANAARTAVVAGTGLAKRALGPERIGALKKRARRSRTAAA